MKKVDPTDHIDRPGMPWRRSLRGRLVFLAILIETVMVALLLSNSFRLLNNAHESQTIARLDALLPLLNASLAGRFQEMENAIHPAVQR